MPSGGYRPGAGRPRKNIQDKKLEGKAMRYTVSLTIGETEAQWVGKVWADGEYLGEVHGNGSGPKANYIELARMHIEAHISCPGDFKPRLRR